MATVIPIQVNVVAGGPIVPYTPDAGACDTLGWRQALDRLRLQRVALSQSPTVRPGGHGLRGGRCYRQNGLGRSRDSQLRQ